MKKKNYADKFDLFQLVEYYIIKISLTISMISVLISFVAETFSSSQIMNIFSKENINVIYLGLIIIFILTITISFFIFLLKKGIGRDKLKQEINRAFINAIDTSILKSKLVAKKVNE